MHAKDSTDVFGERLSAHALAVTAFLDEWITVEPKSGEAGRPEKLVSAMRHGVFNGGKRFRPFLVLESASMAGGAGAKPTNAVMPVAAAIEAIHCYSLIHDDLPAMDDDDLRRGQPTVHIAYDEATAILAGDALLTEAFGMIAGADRIEAGTRCEIARLLASAAGTGGMVGGQSLDLSNEHKSVSEDDIVMTQALKTGALIRAACEMGALAGGGSAADCQRLRHYGELIGLTFQIADDLLDLTSDAATLGKAAGKDTDAGKQTLVSLHGPDWARQKLDALVEEARETIAPYGDDARVLQAAAAFVASRDA